MRSSRAIAQVLGSFFVVASSAFIVAISACEGTSGLAGDDPINAPPRDPKDEAGSSGSVDANGPVNTVDSSVPSGARCDPVKPFDPPQLRTDIDPTATTLRSAVVSANELELHYLRYVGGGVWELRRSTRANRNDDWGPAITTNTGTETTQPVAGLSLSAGGLKAYWWNLESNWVATRPTTDAPFSIPTKFWKTDGPQIFVVANDDSAYYSEYVEGGTEQLIFRAPMNSIASGLLTGVAVKNIHEKGASDHHPVLNRSETAMYFSSNHRDGSKGVADIYVARRASKLDDFGVSAHVLELSTETVDIVDWVSDDDCEILIERASHIHHARRPL